ncbi:MAG: hypothetical protein IJA80_04015 [Clostridia bacterium]|nr:hypothetical protein [Clostridia bacterium]
MFCVLKINRRNQTLFEKLFGTFIKDEYNLSAIPVFKGAPFYLLDAYVGKKGIDWEKVLLCVGKCASRLVVNCEIEIPDNMNIGIYKSEKLYDKIMKNTFLDIVRNNTDKKNLLNISILDKEGKYTEFTETISSFSSSITIATDNKEKYSSVCEKIQKNTGMCPVLTSDFADKHVKINVDTNIMTIRAKDELINISSGENFSVPSIYKSLLPDGIPRYDFYSALYELCGVFSLGECVFDDLMVNNEKKRREDIHFS